MTNPTVCAIMLTKDRPEMARRAVECFRAQTYQNASLLVYDTGRPDEIGCGPKCYRLHDPSASTASIGVLRNLANGMASSDILIHWDDDDWSHPNRITEQVALLQASGADAVGYNELLFWRSAKLMGTKRTVTPIVMFYGAESMDCTEEQWRPAEAWLYTNRNHFYVVGTSLCYWRKTWEQKPFADLPKPGEMKGEDSRWIQDMKVVTVSGMVNPATATYQEPRMIARIHGGNTMAYDIEGQMERGSLEWRRVPEWDAYCRERMAI